MGTMMCYTYLRGKDIMSKLIEELSRNRSAFKYMALFAIIGLLGTTVGTTFDIFWLIMDMLHSLRVDHWITLVGLVIADILMVASTIYFYKAMKIYTENHDKLIKTKRKSKAKISKQTCAIMKLNARIDKLEEENK